MAHLNNRKTFSSNNLLSFRGSDSSSLLLRMNGINTTAGTTAAAAVVNNQSNGEFSTSSFGSLTTDPTITRSTSLQLSTSYNSDHKKDSGFLAVWQQRHQRLSQYGIIKNSPYLSMCLICSLLIILSTIILMSVVFFVLNDEEMDQFKIGIFSLMSSNDMNNWHLKYSSKSDEKYLKFIVFGDWGRRGHFNQSQVADQMGYYCQNFGCDFVISTGDNFYQEGVKSVNDPLFRESFENVYKHESLKKTPFLSVLGNHDYRSNPSAQIEYTNHPSSSKRLYIESEYFSETMYFPEKRIQLLSKDNSQPIGRNLVGKFDFRVQFLFFDTNPFIQKYYTHPKMNKQALHKTRDLRAQKKYMESVMKQLDENIQSGEEDSISYFVNSERSRTNILRKYVNEFEKKPEVPLWKIAIGHHPFYSASTHGDNENLIEHLFPFLRSHDIRYYFSGHDHSIQYLKPYETLNHFISGAGSAVRFDVSKHHPYLKKYQQESGFIYVRLSKDIMELSFVNLFGRVTERIKIPRE